MAYALNSAKDQAASIRACRRHGLALGEFIRDAAWMDNKAHCMEDCGQFW
jgi:hypothetical protein